MSAKTSPRKRRKLFVDTKVQGSLIRQLIIHWSLAYLLIFLYAFTMQSFSNGFALSLKENVVALWQQYGLLALVMVVISPVFIYDSIKLSNRFVGPMISFRNALNQLAKGEDPKPVKFRQNDFWKELSKDLNNVSDELRELRELRGSPADGGNANPELAETE